MLFDKGWFKKHQRILLWFINTWIGRRFFCIQNQIPKGIKITALLPNAYGWFNPDGSKTATFRSHAKFGKRLYYGLMPLWRILHFLDEILLDRWAPAWSFGFTELTFYSDPYPGETNSCDGYVLKYAPDELGAWNSIRNAGYPNDGSTNDGGWLSAGVAAGQYDDGFADCTRAISAFDTSALGAGAVISAAVWSISDGAGGGNFGSNFDLYLLAHDGLDNPPADISGADYFDEGNTLLATAQTLGGSGYDDFTLNSAGENHIELEGLTVFGFVYGDDYLDNDPVTWLAYEFAGVSGISADNAGTSADPKLVITYEGGGSPGNNFFMFD